MPDSSTRHWLGSQRVVLWDESRAQYHVAPALIGVRGQTIDCVVRGRAEDHRDVIGDESVDDLGASLISPAFINGHTHLPMACFRGLQIEGATADNLVEDLFFAVESRMTDEDIGAFAALGAWENLIHGVGLVWEHYYGAEAIASAVASTGLCAVIAPTLQDLSGPGAARWERELDATYALDDPAWAAQGIWSALGPHATDTVSASLWERAVDVASARDLPIHAHVAQSIEEFERAIERHGCSPIAWLHQIGALDRAPSFLLVHAIFASRADLALLDPARHTLAYCPYSQLIFCHPAHVGAWTERGMPWVVGTDAAASNDSMNVQKELRHVSGLRTMGASCAPEYARFVREGSVERAREARAVRASLFAERQHWAEPDFLLDRVWRVPGKLHPQMSAGLIAPGALANVVVWDTDHPSMWPGTRPLRTLAMGDTSAAIRQMMCAGRWLGDRDDYARSLTRHPAYLDAATEASARLEALIGRLNLPRTQ